ncbi:hypothetical protein RFI_13263 [Reticulomyxa filosa]|uniref:Uncharacterized protein n=1 Tax=Reticulomyxa filosa TaxID=46433 RepID=X6NDF0_RETFI|nr:hypothetical protein RFI_13263 [Reticulomyxa filosa]|eukprot:ETO23898.1 hypothetical protein RFI_13263 [Reticulomyxa filosa]
MQTQIELFLNTNDNRLLKVIDFDEFMKHPCVHMLHLLTYLGLDVSNNSNFVQLVNQTVLPIAMNEHQRKSHHKNMDKFRQDNDTALNSKYARIIEYKYSKHFFQKWWVFGFKKIQLMK